MKDTINIILFCIATVCFVAAAVSIPSAIAYGIYDWAVNDTLFKAALWSATKIWLSMVALVIPGLICYVAASIND